MTDVLIDARRGAGSSLEILYGTVTWKPTLTHSRGTSVVLPAPTTFDLVDGRVVATNVQPTPEPVAGQVEWAYEVTFKDRHSKSYSFLVGVPDSTSQVNFTSLPRYFETKPPLFGEGPQGVPGEAATVAVGTVTEGTTAQVTNAGTNTDAVLDFVLPQGPQGPKGDGVNFEYTSSVAPKLFADAPSTYPSGVTEGLHHIASGGWPEFTGTGNVKVTTHKHASYPNASYQIISGYQVDSKPLYRQAISGGAWGPVHELASTDLASTTANGLMSSADKGKLDGYMPILPLNSRTGAEGPTSYPDGTSTLVATNDASWGTIPGLPSGGNLLVVTEGYGATSKRQTVSAHTSSEGTLAYRNSGGGNTWGEWQTIASQDWVAKNREYVTPEQFGAVGDGVADDTNALQQALTFAVESNKQLQLKGGATYRTTSSLTSPLPNASTDVSVDISTYGAGKATIKLVGTTNTDIMTLRGAVMGTTKLTNYVKVLDKSWGATSASTFRAGYLMAVRSSDSWYYDPRPESTDSRKSELHRIYRVTGNDIYSEGPAEDGYNPSVESTDLVAIKPIKVSIKNIHFERDLPAEGTSADGLRRVGLRVYMADEPLLENLSFYGLTASGTRVYDSYNGTIRDCSVKASNNYYEGYGITVAGTAHFLIDNCHIATSRRGVDVSQGTYSVARHTTIQNCVVTGGGRSSRGEWFGWDPLTNALGSRQSGLGTHGAAEYTSYLNNTIYSMTEMLSCNGGHEVAKGNTFIGKTNLACIGLALGGGIAIFEDNVCMSGWMGTSKLALSVSDRRPRDFIQVYPSWNSNNNNNSRLVVRNNYAELQRAFILFGTSSPAVSNIPRYVNVVGNRAGFADGTTTPGYLLYNPTSNLEATGSQWTVGVNELKHDTNAGDVFTTRNINLNGAQVLDFTTSGPTT